jgi:acyl dehydratase
VREIRFDDIEGLRGACSDEFGGPGEPLEITQNMIDDFAALTRDEQWIHVDVERAERESPFGGTIAHGFFVLSLLPGLSDDSDWRIVGHSTTVNYGADKLRFISPVPAGSRIHARRRLVAAEATGKGTRVTAETEVSVVGAPKPALVYRSIALLMS